MHCYRLRYSVFFFLISLGLSAQTTNYQSLAENLLLDKQEEWSLEKDDIKEFEITDRYTSKHNGVTHLYIKQLHNGIPVFNAITNFNIQKGKLLMGSNNFVSQLKSKVKTNQAKLTPTDALVHLTKDLGIKYDKLPTVLKKSSDKKYIFKAASFTKSEIPVSLVYYEDRAGEVHLAWNIELQMSTSPDFWNSLVDANSGKVLKNYNQTLYCKFSEDAFGRVEKCNDHSHHHTHTMQKQSAMSASDGAQYRVYAFPIESPIHGDQSLVVEPSFDFASPFGWHDTNGEEGAEYTITRGNNVWAYEDSMDENKSQGNEPDGGTDLVFDFPRDASLEADSLRESAVTNLFYASNYVHDWAYFYGLDEQAGNYQINNYGNGGRDNDEVQANGLDGERDDMGRLITGNANFSLTRDGSKAFLQMYKWGGSAGTSYLRLDEPQTLAGKIETGSCLFCPAINNTPITGKVVVAQDPRGASTDACQEIINPDEVAGNIALVDRGTCNFSVKVLNAQAAEAIAVIVCNYEDGLVSMSPRELLTEIPSLFLERNDCDAIKASLAEGQDVTLTFQEVRPDDDGPELIAGSYDNGIIAHEYAHGISSRLTGGPSSVCLFNDEQMGEGWSDFVSLVLTHEPGDSGGDIRGIGNYVQTGDPVGKGIRRKPYSTDMNINSHTYNIVRSNRLVPHNLGEVWATMLWDLYWAFVDEYGFNPDWTDKESGNYKAVQLVFDGMKFQGCSPGFVKGRNGIIAADQALFNGEHECMIWEVFANRGLGFFADGGSSNSRNDNEENFDLLPTCIKKVKITKEMTSVIDADNDITVKINVINHKSASVSGTTVIDTLPEGTSYKEGTANVDFVNSGNALIFDLGTMRSLEEKEIKYELETSVDESVSILSEDFESGTSNLTPFPIEFKDTSINVEFRITDIDAFKGQFSYFIPNLDDDLDQSLVTIQSLNISGNRPTLSFRHKYDTEYFFDGGIIEYSEDQGLNFKYLPSDLFLKGHYDTDIDYSTFATPNLQGFTGDSKGWKETYIDLSDFEGKDLLIRFRFGCDDNPSPGDDTGKVNPESKEGTGWYIDNFEIVDLEYIDGNSAWVTTNEGDRASAGDITVINSEFTTPTNEVLEDHNFQVYPNPAQNNVYINFKAEKLGDGLLQLLDINGKLLRSKQIDIRSFNNHQMSLNDLTAGLYLIKVVSEEYTLSSKIVVEN